MENLEIIISSAGAALGSLVAAITFLAKYIKSLKAKKLAENVVKIGNAVIPYIEQAETFTGCNGAAKKAYVLTAASDYANKNGIKFDLDTLSNKIDELVKFTKEVNYTKKEIIEE